MVPFRLVILILDNRYNVAILADKNVDASDLFQLIRVLNIHISFIASFRLMTMGILFILLTVLLPLLENSVSSIPHLQSSLSLMGNLLPTVLRLTRGVTL